MMNTRWSVRNGASFGQWLGLLFAAFLTFQSVDAWADFCNGKQNGLWCDGNNLDNCQGNKIASSQACANGCQSNPPGVADACKAGSGFCSGKMNGLWCNGNDLVNCSNGNTSSSQSCPNGCQSNPSGVADACKAASGPCSGKADGAWCSGSDLLQCKGGSVSSSQSCPNGCQSNSAGVADACKAASGPCSGKTDGTWCSGSDLLQCKGGSVSSSQSCPNGCQSNSAGVADACKAASGPCSGKTDGAWCSGSDLLQCKGGSVSSSQSCPNGCQSNSAGVADACKAGSNPQPTGFCAGKADGDYCDSQTLTTCKGQAVGATNVCKAGCQVNPPGQSDACKAEGPTPTGVCAGKADGNWCNGNALVTCSAGWVQGSQGCALGCSGGGSAGSDKCKTDLTPTPGKDFCNGKSNGAWCNGNSLVTCNGGLSAAGLSCGGGCQSNPPGVPDVCLSASNAGSCKDQPDGQWCQGNAVIKCAGGSVASAMDCANGCAALGGKGQASCNWKKAGFCAAKSDGAWCDGGLLTTCAGGAVANVFACPTGCQQNSAGIADACKSDLPASGGGGGALQVSSSNGCAQFSGSVNLWSGKDLPAYDQKAYADGLGTCPGLSIHSSGCTITSLSMLHAYLGLDRSVGGKSDHTPPFENQWRTEHSGYGQTTYDGKTGNCLVIWGKEPSGLLGSPHHNDASGCLSPSAAQTIATSLNAGMPVVAGVHWGKGGQGEDWHWVLLIGADANGPILNDPWGGKAGVHLSQGALGSYTIDTFYTFFFAPGGGNNDLQQAPPSDKGDPLPADQLPNSLQWLTDDGKLASQTDPNSADVSLSQDGFSLGDAGASITAKPAASGCSAQSSPGKSGGIWVLCALMFAVFSARRRRANR